jgi:hypothetical protein
MVWARFVREAMEGKILQESVRRSFDPARTKMMVAAVAAVAAQAQTYRIRKCPVVVLSVLCFSEELQSTQMTTPQSWRSGQVDPDSSLSPSSQLIPPMLL